MAQITPSKIDPSPTKEALELLFWQNWNTTTPFPSDTLFETTTSTITPSETPLPRTATTPKRSGLEKAGYELTFDRSSDSVNDTTQTLLYSSDLENWNSIDFTTDTDSNVVMEKNDSVDTITIFIPHSEIFSGKLFWKIRAVLTP